MNLGFPVSKSQVDNNLTFASPDACQLGICVLCLKIRGRQNFDFCLSRYEVGRYLSVPSQNPRQLKFEIRFSRSEVAWNLRFASEATRYPGIDVLRLKIGGRQEFAFYVSKSEVARNVRFASQDPRLRAIYLSKSQVPMYVRFTPQYRRQV